MSHNPQIKSVKKISTFLLSIAIGIAVACLYVVLLVAASIQGTEKSRRQYTKAASYQTARRSNLPSQSQSWPHAVKPEALSNQGSPSFPLSGSNLIWEFSLPYAGTFALKQIELDTVISVGNAYTAWDRSRSERINRTGQIAISEPQHHDTERIKMIWIWGERCSCTTVITELLMNNFDLHCPLRGKFADQSSCVISGKPWKHDFMRRADMNSQNDTLHILVTRHPYEWLASFRRNGFFANFHKGREMKNFLTLEWVSIDAPGNLQSRLDAYISGTEPIIGGQRLQSLGGPQRIDSRPLGVHAVSTLNFTNVTEMMSDRDPDTGERFPTILAMREAKLRDWLRVSAYLKYADHVACRDFMLNPRDVLERLQKRYGLAKRRTDWNVHGCHWRFGGCSVSQGVSGDRAQREKRDYYLGMRFMADFNRETLAIANAWLDPENSVIEECGSKTPWSIGGCLRPNECWDMDGREGAQLEGQFGYRLFDNIQEASIPYTAASSPDIELEITAAGFTIVAVVTTIL